MGLRIATSSPLRSTVSLGQSLRQVNRVLGQLISGHRLGRAADGPADLIRAEHLRASWVSLRQERANYEQQIGRYTTVSGQMDELAISLTELRSLAVGAANSGGNSEAAQRAYADVANRLIDRYNETINNSTYNGHPTLNGAAGSLVQLHHLTDVNLDSPEAASTAIATIDAAAAELSSARVDVGAAQRYDLESRLRSLQITEQNLMAAESTLRDVDFGVAYSEFVSGMLRARLDLALRSHQWLSGASVLELLDRP